jgi:hypothetical protein
MADNMQNPGRADRARVSANEEHEVQYLTRKYGVDAAIVRKAISEVGNNRSDVEEFFTEYKKGNPI